VVHFGNQAATRPELVHENYNFETERLYVPLERVMEIVRFKLVSLQNVRHCLSMTVP